MTAQTAIARLRICGARDAARTRMLVERQMSGAEITADGLAPAAIMVVRHLRDPFPGVVGANEAFAPPADWQDAVKSALTRLVQDAARPRDGAAMEQADAILFDDRAELLAFLVLDTARGVAGQRWWWQRVHLLLPELGKPVAEIHAAHALTAYVEDAPAVFETLTALNAVAEVLESFSVAQVEVVVQAMVARGLAPAASIENAGSESSAHGLTEPARAKQDMKPQAAMWSAWRDWLPDTPAVAQLPGAHQCLLALTLAVRHAPALVRAGMLDANDANDAFRAREALRPTESEDVGVAPEARPVANSDLVSRRVETQAHDKFQRTPARAGVQNAETQRAPEFTDSLPHSSDAQRPRSDGGIDLQRSGDDTKHDPGKFEERPGHTYNPPRQPDLAAGPDAPLKNSVAPAALSAAALGLASGVVLDETRDSEAQGVGQRADPRELALPGGPDAAPGAVEAVSGGQRVLTQLAGVFYLIHVMEDLGAPSADEGGIVLLERYGCWGMLALVAQVLLAERLPAYAQDPIWSLLEALAIDTGGREARGALASPQGITLQSDSAIERLAARVARRLGQALDDEPDLDTLVHLLALPGEIFASNAHVDVVLSIDSISLAVRRVGLDRDPGWMANYGRVVLFHFR